MRSLLDVLLHPQRTPPPPLDVDLARVMSAGTLVWAVALLVSAVLWASGVATGTTVAVCGAGTLVGVAGVVWSRRHVAHERAAQDAAQDAAHADVDAT